MPPSFGVKHNLYFEIPFNFPSETNALKISFRFAVFCLMIAIFLKRAPTTTTTPEKLETPAR